MGEITQVQKTIVEQLQGLNPLFRAEYGVKEMVGIADGYGVRLHTRRGKVVNIDIVYKPCPDAYEVKAYEVDGAECREIANKPEIYFDQLHEVIRAILGIERPAIRLIDVATGKALFFA